ncbi:hypothetical protein TTHERM_01444870 (macronuclear) [Tetrahymena thermophila SB210]|uniref:Uncharacterized protein n=1 Tax=Tetrahymena thermophila (strain SB210) TaxID=312017 RepID=Q229B5_TETTS|nr:hypothetical protein TTHERM_01444870 [Tetrahymena thermophila SB210]EAR81878.1 hypothetical protein TTHERM_01444870 [Tetrahymena thermophila SB210]|eukprot:XP_001029541.1 hypothetical protein TTHERM_01444870 [Tetrahymena thermophila SB210]
MEQEIDFVISCYGDDDLDYSKYIDHSNDNLYDRKEKLRDSFATQANSLFQSASNILCESLTSNASFTSIQRNNSMQEQTDMKNSFNYYSQVECDNSNNNIQSVNPQEKRCSIDIKCLQKEYNYESISKIFQDNSTAFLHGEIAIQKQSTAYSFSDSDFMNQDILKYHKQVCNITQTSNFLHVELSQIQQSNQQQINNIKFQWEQEKNEELAWNSEQPYLYNQEDYENVQQNQSQELCNLINDYTHIISQQQQYFQQSFEHKDFYLQNIQSQERFDSINKRAFKILRKLQQNSKTSIFSYKIVRKTPFEYITLSRGLSNSFFDKLGLDKQETSQYIMRNNCLPLNCYINTQEKLKQSFQEIVTHLSFLHSNNNYKRTYQCGEMQFNAIIERQFFALNQQIGDQILDINDYLIVEIMQIEDQQINQFSQQMKQRKQQFGFCFDSTEFQYKVMSSNIVDRYYQNYSEQQRQENQIIRLLNKKNHRFH